MYKITIYMGLVHYPSTAAKSVMWFYRNVCKVHGKYELQKIREETKRKENKSLQVVIDRT